MAKGGRVRERLRKEESGQVDLGFDLDYVTSGKCLPLSGQISSSVQWGRETVFRVPKLMAYGLPLVHNWFCLIPIVFLKKKSG